MPLDLIEFFFLTPLPGSEDHKVLHAKGVWMDPDLNKYDLNHRVTHHPIMSDAAWEKVYFDSWRQFYTPKHVETVLRRDAARGKRTSVGRIDMVENRVVGLKEREIYEAPAAVVLHAAHKELQKMVVATSLDRFSRAVSLQYADTIYNGLWFAPLREALDAFIDKVQERVTGVIRMKLFKGDCRVVGRKSPFALYEPAAAATTTT